MALLARWPGTIKPESVSEDIVLNVDFAPTMLEAADAAVTPDMIDEPQAMKQMNDPKVAAALAD